MRLTFCGATGTVTGSRYLVSGGGGELLVDCGLFQGFKQLRLRNREAPPFSAKGLAAVLLTHAHLDHSGYLPLLVKNGYAGRVLCTPATRDLCAILLPDSGHLLEEEAAYARRRGYSKHDPPLPLYTMAEARASLKQFVPVRAGRSTQVAGFGARFVGAGHLLGASSVLLSSKEGSILFSGDLGRPNDALLFPPQPRVESDYLVVESTYGHRRHEASDPQQKLAEVIRRTVARGGVVLIPSFAVGRAQQVLLQIARLKAERRIPEVPVYLNSPMASRATGILGTHVGEHRLSAAECESLAAAARWVDTPEESKALNERREPMVIVAASGMVTGGRVLHHVKAFAPEARNTILFCGFQAAGTRGAAILAGAESVKIHGAAVPIRCEVASIDNLSSHADADEILDWLRSAPNAPRLTFVTHGEPEAADALRRRIAEELGWECRVPEYRDRYELGASGWRKSRRG
jgi:metallo-beta-lactamase family protein